MKAQKTVRRNEGFFCGTPPEKGRARAETPENGTRQCVARSVVTTTTAISYGYFMAEDLIKDY